MAAPNRPALPCFLTRALLALLALAAAAPGSAQQPAPAAARLKDEIRLPWSRSQERFIRQWRVLGEVPLSAAPDAFAQDPFAGGAGEAALRPDDPNPPKLADGRALRWRNVTSWGDAVDLSDGNGLKRDLVAYAATVVKRESAGKARLCLGSDGSLRAWVNGRLVVDRPGPRLLAFDEDQVEVDLQAGDNLLLVKVGQRTGFWGFAARVLESGALPPRVQEIAPSWSLDGTALVVRTDLNADRAAEAEVGVQAVAPGGRLLAEATAARGGNVRFDTAAWPDGPCEIRCTTTTPAGLRWATHLPWFKGDAVAAARTLVDAAARADVATPAGQIVKMLGDMVLDRLGAEGLAITGNPWWAIHSPLMEFAELQLEAAGHADARARSHGFYRLAWRDEIDGSPQFARAYLPIGYDPAKKWPVVVKLHGFNPANPVYVRWWSSDLRHNLADVEYGRGQGVIYIEPHGRGNNQYLGLGDQDVVRVIRLARERFSVDPDRVYLTGDSMGGWGTWNVATRHPDLFAAIAPIYGGVDFHSYLTEEQLAALDPLNRFLQEKNSSWSTGEGLFNLPVFVHHGDADAAVPVDWSRYGVRLLQRWGYDVRYFEMPGYAHEDINRWPAIFAWFLEHRRDPQPRRVRFRSAERQSAAAYWVTVDQFDRPDRFMVVDAEAVGANTIRLDTQNVLAVTLAPGPALVDPARPVRVVWNGEPHSASLRDGRLSLAASGYAARAGAKDPAIAGPLGDILNTPFAIVTGTASPDPEMNALLARKSAELAAYWLEWQRQPARLFKDAELSDADAARYSLVLVGGADSNLVTRRLAGRLAFKVAPDHVEIDGRSFAATDARLQLIRPNPLNPARYVVVTAASSPLALQTWQPRSLQGAQFDFTIEDSRVPAAGQQPARTALWVAGGWFDRDWKLDDGLVHPGNAAARAKALALHPLPAPAVLDAFTGSYEVAPGVVAVVRRQGAQLTGQVGDGPAVEMFSVTGDTFYVFDGSLVVVFTRDSAGKVVAFTATGQARSFGGRKTG